VENVCGLTGRLDIWGAAPRRSGDEVRDTPEHETQKFLGGARRREVNPDHRLHLDDASSEELLEAAHLAFLRRGLEARLRADLEKPLAYS
jgi:hypothetical protein